MKKIKSSYADVSLRNKFLMTHIAMLIVVCTVILMFTGFVFGNYDQMLYENTAQILSMTVSSIERDLLDVQMLSESMALDRVFQSAFRLVPGTNEPNARKKEPTSSYNQAAVEVMAGLSAYAGRGRDQMSVSILVEDQRFVAGRNREEAPPERIETARELARLADGGVVWMTGGHGDNSLFCVRELKDTMNLTLETLGLIVIRVDLDQIISRNLKDNPNLSYIPRIAVMSDGEIIYTDVGEQLVSQPLSGQGAYGVLFGDAGKYFVSETDSSHIGWQYRLYLPFDQVLGSIRSLRIAAVVIVVCMAALSVAVFALLVSRILYHFDNLVEKMKLFTRDAPPVPFHYDYSGRQDELGYLHRSFDNMAAEARRLIEDNYVKQILIRDAHIRSLQQQINPHFLFNILQTINWKAKSSGQTEISDIVESMGKVIRYSLNTKNDLVTLREEVEITRHYIAIQKYRYEHRLTVTIDIPPAPENAPLPRMALQNIVENSIKHGLEAMLEPCHIRIYTERDGDYFTLYVEDNGPGIDENILDRPDGNPESGTGLGIGLQNLHRRVQLLLSDQCGLALRNTGHGTLVGIRLPVAGGLGPRRDENEREDGNNVSPSAGG